MKYYKAHMSNRETVTLDEEDFAKLVEGMNSGSFVKLKQAIINPSFLMMIVPLSKTNAMQEVIPERKIEGHIDERTGTFKVLKDELPIVAQLQDRFSTV